ncbi:MAG: hypothetical protein N3D10_04205 [Candidatus Micrarchaeota archaeon]|nr:hypothetical protein [Candidatus Micrarchaeota archaeon]
MRKILISLIFLCLSFFIYSDSIDISVGGAFTGYFIPSVNYRSIDVTTKSETPLGTQKKSSKIDSVNLFFGFAITVPVTFLYNLPSGWGFGAAMELGYSFLGGPEVYISEKPDDYVIGDYTYFYNSFLGIFNFLARTPDLGNGFKLLLEGGLIVRPGALIGIYQNNEIIKFPIKGGDTPFRGLGYVGPNLFVGFYKELVKSLVIMPGFRPTFEFGYYPLIDKSSTMSITQNEFYFLATFGLEFRMLWNLNIPLKSKKRSSTQQPSQQQTKPTQQPKQQQKR